MGDYFKFWWMVPLFLAILNMVIVQYFGYRRIGAHISDIQTITAIPPSQLTKRWAEIEPILARKHDPTRVENVLNSLIAPLLGIGGAILMVLLAFKV